MKLTDKQLQIGAIIWTVVAFALCYFMQVFANG